MDRNYKLIIGGAAGLAVGVFSSCSIESHIENHYNWGDVVKIRRMESEVEGINPLEFNYLLVADSQAGKDFRAKNQEMVNEYNHLKDHPGVKGALKRETNWRGAEYFSMALAAVSMIVSGIGAGLYIGRIASPPITPATTPPVTSTP
ncbi:hypothetical protein J4408_00300 [Candidatus Pacearchaeota archaeon]|nr:hypothetical protein [Candidatus Pacearchaeota archaeon]